MNNMSTSECSSGCESGWTAYLDHTSATTAYQYDQNQWRSIGLNVDQQNPETEDLSMVSDASSGPRCMQDGDRSSAYFSASASGLEQVKKKQKSKVKDKKLQDTHLVDTASSPVAKVSFSVLEQSSESFDYFVIHLCTGHWVRCSLLMHAFLEQVWPFHQPSFNDAKSELLCNSAEGKIWIAETFWLSEILCFWKSSFT
ncbi:protein SOB FIVE-LIKE 5 isoform X1 [Daucus carota subsp. sativus]|uniref:protein SOB FIVE-LIKE 5 isoform X1 n=1 Tax=Daucus carota subsp. sativus TaxID=79200 RepID=UPI003082F77A